MTISRRRFLLGLSAFAVAGCRTHPRTTGAQPSTLRVMTYNLHHGEGLDGRIDLPRIAAVIREAKPDLVALQEVDRKAQRTGVVDQAAEYIRLTGMHGWYGAAMPFQGGEYGQVLLSRWPLRAPRVVRLPGTPGREPRIATTACVDIPGLGTIRWAGLHLDASRDDADRWQQAGALLAAFPIQELPTLLAGDFNAVPDSRVMKRLLDPSTGWVDTAGVRAALTDPADTPKVRIDYVLAAPSSAWRILDSKVIPETVASDHRPVVVDLQFVAS